jgi:hypothetical protein
MSKIQNNAQVVLRVAPGLGPVLGWIKRKSDHYLTPGLHNEAMQGHLSGTTKTTMFHMSFPKNFDPP